MKKLLIILMSAGLLALPAWGKKKSKDDSLHRENKIVECIISIPRVHYNIIDSCFNKRYYDYLKIYKVCEASPDGLYQVVLYQKEQEHLCRITYRIKISNDQLVQCEEQQVIVLGGSSGSSGGRSFGSFSGGNLNRMF